MNDTIARYESFLAVAECGSISGAAKRLYVTQPAISTEIAQLERALSVQLFVRTNRGVSLTPEGRVLYEHVAKGFSFLRAGEDKLREFTDLRSGTLRIGASDMTLRFFLLDYIADFRQRYPAVHLHIENGPTPKTLEALRAGKIDFAVISGPLPQGERDDLVLIPVKKIQDIFVAHEDFEIAHQAVVEKDQLRDCPLIMLGQHTATRRYVSAWLGEGFPAPAIELATSDLLLEFAERGIGVCAVTEDFAHAAITAGRVVRLPLAEEIPPRYFYVAYLRRLPVSAAAGYMLGRLEEVRLDEDL